MKVTRHDEPPAGWDDLARELGTFYHQRAWITGLARCLRYRTHWLAAREGDRLVGALALAEVPGLLGGVRLASYPFSFIAGPMARGPEVATALAMEAQSLTAERRARRVEIKQFGPTAQPPAPGWIRSDRYRTYRVLPDGGEGAVWKRLHVTSTQQRIRKGQKAGVEVVDGRSAEDWLAMAQLEEKVQQGHGVPAPPRALFLDVCRGLQESGLADLYLARVPGGRIAAGFVMFKERWGARGEPLAYDYWPDAGGLLNARRDRGALAVAARVWAALPAPIARLGSALYRYLG